MSDLGYADYIDIVNVGYCGHEGCFECGRPMEITPGLYVGGSIVHLVVPDLFCEECAETLVPGITARLRYERRLSQDQWPPVWASPSWESGRWSDVDAA